MQEIILSNHGRQRIKDRCGVKKSAAKRVAQRAQEKGIERNQTKGSLRKWLDARYSRSNAGGREGCSSIWLYGEKAFIFSQNNVLITVLPLPSELKRAAKANMEKRG